MDDTTGLFTPAHVGHAQLNHRVVMAPMTRRRAAKNYVPSPVMAEYYGQRASTKGTLIISEATAVSERAAAPPNTPGIWNSQQVEAWKAVTDTVHEQGSYIFVQLWSCGRAAKADAIANGAELRSAGDIPVIPGDPQPRPLTEEEIQECIFEHAQAARNAIEAGFDGVELHGANGYLLDQFTQEVSNNRSDRWGGSIENRSRFALAVAQAVVDEVGAERVGYRVSPWSIYQGMRMKDPVPQFTDLVSKLKALELGYIHIIESRVQGPLDTAGEESIDFLADIWDKISPIIFAGGYNATTASERVLQSQSLGRTALVAFGRTFLSNPDLPLRIQKMFPVAPYNRELFYEVGKLEGYIDYPVWKKPPGDDLPQHSWPTCVSSKALR